MAKALEELGDILKTLSAGEIAMTSALNMHPKILARILDRGIGFARAKKLEEAEKIFADVVRVETRAFVPCILLASVRVERGNFAGAVRAYDQALARGALFDPSDLAQRIFIARARANLALGNLETAKRDLEVASRGGTSKVANLALTMLGRMP